MIFQLTAITITTHKEKLFRKKKRNNTSKQLFHFLFLLEIQFDFTVHHINVVHKIWVVAGHTLIYHNRNNNSNSKEVVCFSCLVQCSLLSVVSFNDSSWGVMKTILMMILPLPIKETMKIATTIISFYLEELFLKDRSKINHR